MNDRDRFHNGRVTVVLPTYNRAGLARRAIESVLAQTARAVCDLVVVDDGSTDATPQVVACYADQVRYVRQSNAGVSAARNTGVRAQPNEFVAFLDSDDVWEPDKVARQLAALRRYPTAVLCAGRVMRLDAVDGTELPGTAVSVPTGCATDFAPALFEGNFLGTSTVLARSDILARVGLFRTDLRICEDYHLWVRIACRGPGVYLDQQLATYSVGSPFSLAYSPSRLLREELRARYLLRRELRGRQDCRGHWQRGLALSLSSLRDVAYREQRYGDAARHGLRALLHRPWDGARWEWARLFEATFRATLGNASRQPAHRFRVSTSPGGRPCARNPG